MLGSETAARHHERGVAVGQRDADAGGHEGTFSRFEAYSFGRDKIGAGITRMGIVRQHRRDNGEINGIAHPTRLMQNPTPDTLVRYRERLSPSLWLLVTAAVAGPMVALTFTPLGSLPALLIGAAAAVVLIAALIAASPAVRVTGTVLHAGRAHIDARWLGTGAALTGDDAREARGTALPARGWHLIRGGIDGVVVVQNTDPNDPVTSWTISTRTPDRLLAAIRDAQVAASANA